MHHSTSGVRFVDTNVLVYAVVGAPDEAPKTAIANDLLSARDLVLSTQVLQEFYVQVTRTSRPGALSHAEATLLVMSLTRFPVQDITLRVLYAALEYRERFDLSYWDAAILASAKVAGCRTVVSEDFSTSQDYDGIRVVDPFA